MRSRQADGMLDVVLHRALGHVEELDFLVAVATAIRRRISVSRSVEDQTVRLVKSFCMRSRPVSSARDHRRHSEPPAATVFTASTSCSAASLSGSHAPAFKPASTVDRRRTVRMIVGGSAFLRQGIEHVEPQHAGHAHVEQHDIGLGLPDHFNGLRHRYFGATRISSDNSSNGGCLAAPGSGRRPGARSCYLAVRSKWKKNQERWSPDKAREGDIVGAMATTSNAGLAGEIERVAFSSIVTGQVPPKVTRRRERNPCRARS